MMGRVPTRLVDIVVTQCPLLDASEECPTIATTTVRGDVLVSPLVTCAPRRFL